MILASRLMNLTDHVAKQKDTQSYIFVLHNIKKIRPFLSKHGVQFLVQGFGMSSKKHKNTFLSSLAQ